MVGKEKIIKLPIHVRFYRTKCSCGECDYFLHTSSQWNQKTCFDKYFATYHNIATTKLLLGRIFCNDLCVISWDFIFLKLQMIGMSAKHVCKCSTNMLFDCFFGILEGVHSTVVFKWNDGSYYHSEKYFKN